MSGWTQSDPSLDGVPFESTLANDSWLFRPLQVDLGLVLCRPIETTALTGQVKWPGGPYSEFGSSNLFARFEISLGLEKLHKIGRRTENPAFQIRSSWAQFDSFLRFWRLEKSISYVFSTPVNIPTPPPPPLSGK